MSKTSNQFHALRALRLILCLGSLPLLASATGCASNRTAQNDAERRSAAQRKEDHYTSYRVAAALANDGRYECLREVHVRTFDSVVELSGCVNSSLLKDRAGDIARRVVGIKDVHDGITVKESLN
jgi:osmotically-inducible protein OsmY